MKRTKLPPNFHIFFLVVSSFIFFSASTNVSAQNSDASIAIRKLTESFQFEEAIRVSDTYLAADSTDASLLLLKSKALSSLFRFRESNALLLKVVKTDSANIKVWFELFNNYRLLGNVALAAYSCKRLLELDPGNRYFSIQLANLYYNADDFERAKMVMIPLYLADTTDYFIVRQIGNCYLELNMPYSAGEFYSKALALNPFDGSTAAKLINLYIKGKDLTRAMKMAETFLTTDSLNIQVLRLYGYSYYLSKDYLMAEKYLLKSIMNGDDSKFARKYLGLTYYKTEKYDLAERQFKHAYVLDTTDSEITFYYGVSAQRSMLPDTGLIMLRKTLNLIMPSDQFLATLYMELSNAYLSVGNADTAMKILLKAHESFPGNSDILFKIAYHFDYDLREPVKAEPWYREFMAIAQPQEVDSLVPQTVSKYDYVKNRLQQIAPKPTKNEKRR
jgi:tetratricopeptide (TPR) repeat protein